MLDKQETPQKINRLLKSEILYLLKNYFEICSEDLSVDINIDDCGKYLLNINGLCRNIKVAHLFSEN
jgi:hypothetical protein